MSRFRYPAAMKLLVCLGIPLLFIGPALSATPPARLASPHVDSVELIQLLGLDEMMSAIMNRTAQQALEAGRITGAQQACLQSKPVDFTEGLAAAARAELTAGEIASAVAYLRSKEGRKFGELVAHVDSATTTPPDVSSSEAAAFEAFHDSPAGKKLDETSLLTKSEGTNEFLGVRAKQVIAKCHLTQPLQPPDEPQK